MALILETGEGLADAESVVTLVEVRAFASSRGITVSAVDADLEVQLRKAHDYLISLEPRLQGQRRVATQALPYPRCGVILFGKCVAKDELPATLKSGVCQLVIEQIANPDLTPTVSPQMVVSEAVGPISTTYASTGSSSQSYQMPRVEAYLSPLFKGGGGMALRTERV